MEAAVDFEKLVRAQIPNPHAHIHTLVPRGRQLVSPQKSKPNTYFLLMREATVRVEFQKLVAKTPYKVRLG